mmetsp:Transcript_65545/g.202835  ORF Transcript_65545/g.202835 Transcript_65545/m.202835 type:complete len:220 (+) Transcript_65545:1891-2550(+)
MKDPTIEFTRLAKLFSKDPDAPRSRSRLAISSVASRRLTASLAGSAASSAQARMHPGACNWETSSPSNFRLESIASAWAATEMLRMSTETFRLCTNAGSCLCSGATSSCSDAESENRPAEAAASRVPLLPFSRTPGARTEVRPSACTAPSRMAKSSVIANRCATSWRKAPLPTRVECQAAKRSASIAFPSRMGGYAPQSMVGARASGRGGIAGGSTPYW